MEVYCSVHSLYSGIYENNLELRTIIFIIVQFKTTFPNLELTHNGDKERKKRSTPNIVVEYGRMGHDPPMPHQGLVMLWQKKKLGRRDSFPGQRAPPVAEL